MARPKKNAAETVKAEAPAKKTTAPAKKADEVFVQFAGNEINVADVVAAAKAAFKEQAGRKAVKSCQVYVKPEENAAYYVINDDFTGKIEL